ncbi:hypothetical protein IG193_04475 [Infirmifilum lucidum]|uniref:Uncharacterized protein n=1 Tax=Infirmifilum lucidum TaxID=2776706 RepID=A0A7L9FLJ9_9CREN|nr:hypothetical protein [Infirmifilum lucidum]QOJ79715.1 hypothetical protein IG193_04475 [Infirmifilum lucidum]
MKTQFKGWATLLILAAILLPYYAFSQPSTPAKATLTARLEYSYGLVFYNLELPEATSTLSFNISGFNDRLVLGVARAPRQPTVLGVSDGKVVSFKFREPVRQVNFTFVFRVVNVSQQKVEIMLPVPLSPLGYITDVSGSVTFTAGVALNSTVGKVTGSQISYNLTATSGVLDVVRGSSHISQIPLGQIARLNRTILVEPGKVVFEDTVEVRTLSNYPIETLTLNLPRGYVFDGAMGVLGPYPRNYWRVYNASNSTLVTLNLMSSPQLAGQRTVLTLRFHTALSSSINAFLGWGATIEEYSIRVCIRGTLSLPQQYVTGEVVEDTMRCYILKPMGPLFLSDIYPNVPVTSVAFQPQTNTTALAGIIVLLAVVASGVYALVKVRQKPIEKVRDKVLERVVLSTETREKLEKNLVRREELLLSLLGQLRGLRERRAGTARIMSLIREYEKKDATIETEIAKLLGQLGDKGRSMASELASISSSLREKLRELERTERDYRVGRLEKKEYQERIEKIESELRKLSQMFREIYEKYL